MDVKPILAGVNLVASPDESRHKNPLNDCLGINDMPDAIETATALVEESGSDGEGFAGSGMVITGSVVTAGAARTRFGRDPE